MTNLLRKKREQEKEEVERGKKSRQKKLRAAKVALLTVTILVGVVVVVSAFNSANQRHRILGTPPNRYQTGLLVNNETKTFVFDGEWNFNFTPGSAVQVKLLLSGGVGVQVTFGTISAFNTDPFGSPHGPFVMSGSLKPSTPTMSWSGTVPAGGAYRLELVNLGDESNVASVQAYVNAS